MAEAMLIHRNTYYDSAALMAIAQRVKAEEGVSEAVAVMGTDHNQELLLEVGLSTAAARDATPRDLIIAVRADTSAEAEAALAHMEEALDSRSRAVEQHAGPRPRTLEEAFQHVPETNMALVSVPGQYASREAEVALRAGRHVMLFSDNVSLEDEVRLKKLASASGLLVMGPDCGTAFINGVPLGFANAVRRGPVGIVAAAGTGLQEVACGIHRYGSGVSQGIGTGGRDVSDAVGGLTMLLGLDALLEDASTEVVVLVSKPPGKEVLERVAARIATSNKPVIAVMLGGDRQLIEDAGAFYASDLMEGARAAAQAAGAETDSQSRTTSTELAEQIASGIAPGRQLLRGLYTGGTLCHECLVTLQGHLEVSSNLGHPTSDTETPGQSLYGHYVIDLGDDEFTRGRPHPMIEPTLRTERLLNEIEDDRVGVLLLDFVLGYGSHLDPAGACLQALSEARERGICVVASVTGTELDPQDRDEQVRKLESVGVWVMPSNAEAVKLAGDVVTAIMGAGV